MLVKFVLVFNNLNKKMDPEHLYGYNTEGLQLIAERLKLTQDRVPHLLHTLFVLKSNLTWHVAAFTLKLPNAGAARRCVTSFLREHEPALVMDESVRFCE